MSIDIQVFLVEDAFELHSLVKHQRSGKVDELKTTIDQISAAAGALPVVGDNIAVGEDEFKVLIRRYSARQFCIEADKQKFRGKVRVSFGIGPA